MFVLITLLFLVILILIRYEHFGYKNETNFKCFLLTLPNEKKRHETFLKSYHSNIPLEIIYSKDTRNIKIASEFEENIDPEYFEKALEMHYNPSVKRPDITYFNLGAIGCFMGHMEFYKRCFRQKLKYAVIFEDNVIIKSNKIYKEIQDVIDKKGDNFEMCFFHCLSRIPENKEEDLEKVKWISSTKCYLVNVDNMRKYIHHFYPMDNHVDMKHEDLIDKGARIYYKDLRNCIKIDRSQSSIIAHSDHGRKGFVSRRNPSSTPNDVVWGF